MIVKLYLRYIKEYKKNTITVFICFLLTSILMSALLILMHTNHREEALLNMLTHTPADVRIEKLDKTQIELLESNDQISKIAVFEEPKYVLCDENRIYFERADNLGITLTSRLEKGRMPESENEIVVEKWVLLNLGKTSSISQIISLENEDTGIAQDYKVVGILSDVLRNKQVGLLTMYSCMSNDYDGVYSSYVNYKNTWNIEKEKKKTSDALGIKVSNIKNSPGRENMGELLCMDVAVVAIILLFFSIIFSGIFRIQLTARQEQYGLLRAIGIKKNIFIKYLLSELGIIYIIAFPIGIIIGVFVAWIVTKLSGSENQIIYFYGEKVELELIIPILQILIGIVLLVGVTIIIGLIACRNIYEKTIIEVISNEINPLIHKSSWVLHLDKGKNKILTLWKLSVKYVVRDLKTSFLIILTIAMGVSLFYGLIYEAQIAGNIRYETREMYFFNGEYAMSVLTFQTADYGISRESVEEILELEQVKEIETAAGLPIRVVDNSEVKRNKQYYDNARQKMEEIYGYSGEGDDGEDQVYKSVLYGYNDNALKKLQKYIVDGNYIPEQVDEDEVIICEMRKSYDKEESQSVGWYKDGEPLMQYKVGDNIRIKYREDLQTNSIDYESFTDDASEYTSKEYKIIAIVSFPYIADITYSQYPIFITKDAYIKSMIENSKVQSIYINGVDGMSEEEASELEDRLISIGAKNSQVSTRSLIPEREKADMLFRKEIVNLGGIALVFLILALTNIANNMKFRIQMRKKEMCILRAIGMKYQMVKQIVVLEILNICMVSFVGGCGIARIISKFMYTQSDLKDFGYIYKFDIIIYLLVCLAAFLICTFISHQIVKKSTNKNIIVELSNIE